MSLRARFVLVVMATVAIFVIDMIAVRLYLYWSYSWFDSFMHGISGIVAGYAALSGCALFVRRAQGGMPYVPRWWQAILGALIIGIIWEGAELLMHVSHLSPTFLGDTISDLCFDITGGLISYILWII